MNTEIKNKPYILRKIIATLIDYAILFYVIYLYMSKFGEQNNEGDYTVEGIYTLPVILMWLIYLPGSESLLSRTIGHMIVGLRIIDHTGGKPGILQTIKRRLADPVDLILFGIPAIIAINKTENNQRLGDLWADTLVVSNNDPNTNTSG
jgi:uncharacterized RDD family membrane protein YckC